MNSQYIGLGRDPQQFIMTGRGIDFEVFGLPVSQGSKKAFIKRHKVRDYAVVVDDEGPELRNWRGMVIDKARAARIAGGITSPLGAAMVRCEFYFPRPANHYGVKGLLTSAPLVKVTKPDLDKLVRAVWDSLTQAYIVLDDSAICHSEEFKAFGEPSVAIHVRELVLRQGQVPLELAGPDGST